MPEKEGQYIYAIAAINEEKNFGPIGIGDRKDEVYTVCHKDIGAVISASHVDKYSVYPEPIQWRIRRSWKRL